MDIAVGGAVAGVAAGLWQMEQPLQAVFPLVRQWVMGEAARLFYLSG